MASYTELEEREMINIGILFPDGVGRIIYYDIQRMEDGDYEMIMFRRAFSDSFLRKQDLWEWLANENSSEEYFSTLGDALEYARNDCSMEVELKQYDILPMNFQEALSMYSLSPQFFVFEDR